MKSKIRCATPSCIKAIKEHGEDYHRVYEPRFLSDDYEAKCERCGGIFKDSKWQHICSYCGKEVEPGELRGLFVPHGCADCIKEIAEAERKSGQVCRMCGKVYSQCYC